ADHVRATVKPADRKSDRSLSDQFNHGAGSRPRRGWRRHALHPARIARQGKGAQLATGAGRPVLHDHARVLAQTRSPGRQLEGAACGPHGAVTCAGGGEMLPLACIPSQPSARISVEAHIMKNARIVISSLSAALIVALAG